MKVIVRDNDVGKASRLLKRKLHNEGVLKEVHNRRAFVSVGEKKRAALKSAKLRWNKKRVKLEQQFAREERNLLRNNKNRRRTKSKSSLQKR